MLDTLLLRPSLYCNTSLHFTTLDPTKLHYTYRHCTSSRLNFTTLSFGLTQLHFLSFDFISHHQTRHSIVLISKLISKIMNPYSNKEKTVFKYIPKCLFYLSAIPFNYCLLLHYKPVYIMREKLQIGIAPFSSKHSK